ncbi:MAG: M14 family metallopeptidase [Nitrospinales bacterium]
MIKEKIVSIQSPFGEPVALYKNAWDGGKTDDSLSIVGGLHGDQLNGLYIASRLTRFLQAVQEKREEGFRLQGKIQIFPIANPQAMQSGSQVWSFDGLDMDLAFPGNEYGEVADKLCHALLRHTADSTYGIVLSSGIRHYEDFPHIQIFRPDRKLKKFARSLELSAVREIPDSALIRIQLLPQWVERGVVPAILAWGKADTLARTHCDAVFDGLVNMMLSTGLLTHPSRKGRKTEIEFFEAKRERSIVATQAGLFVPEAQVGDSVAKGQRLGVMRDIYSGECVEEFTAPEDGLLVTLRSHPLAYEKEPIAILLAGEKTARFRPF